MWRASTLFIFLIALLTAGCETALIIFSGPYFVRFTDINKSVKESFSKEILIEVHQAGPAPENDLIINYEISGNARAGIDYKINGVVGKVVIKKGEYLGNISVSLINNSNNIIRSQDLVITLASTDNTDRKIGQGESNIGSAFTLTIIDDCILGGSYIGQRSSVNVSDIKITSSDCENYILSNWNININLFNPGIPMDLRFIDNGDNTLTIPTQEEEALDPTKATIEGFGVVDPTTRKIIMTITLVDFTDQPQVTITYLPD